MNQILTSSRLKAFRTCARLHQHRYIDCKVPFTESLPARFGTMFHTALEHWWLAYQLSPDDRLGVARHALLSGHATVDEEEAVVADELLLGYHLRWLDEPLVTQLAEHQFEMPLVNPTTGRSSRTYTLSGKIDAKVFDTRDERAYLVEHKTTTSDIGEGAGYWQRLRMDGQISVYYDAFPDVAGCIYDVIRRPGLRRLKATPEAARTYTKGKACRVCLQWMQLGADEYARRQPCPACKGSHYEVPPKLYATQRAEDETLDEFRLRIRDAIAAEPDSYYKRGVVVRLDSEIREHKLDIWHQANLMREMANESLAPRNPDACLQFNRKCDYFDVCTSVASIEDPRLFQIRDAHPELNQETK